MFAWGRWWRILVACGLSIPVCALAAVERPSAVVLVRGAQPAAPYQLASEALAQELARRSKPAASPRLLVLIDADLLASVSEPVGLYVAFGSHACEQLAQRPRQVAVLCAMLPKVEFERIQQRLSPAAAQRTAALVLDQPLVRQVRLMRLVWPDKQRLGVLLGDQSTQLRPALQAAARAAGFELLVARLPKDAPNFEALLNLLKRSELLWALPDPDVFNVQFAYNILLASWQQGVPLFGFSPALVKAGAVLGLYATPSQVGEEVAGLVWAMLRGDAAAGSVHEPRMFEVGWNSKVGAAYGLQRDGQTLTNQLRAQEGLR